jgi:PAS domain S-box-containing protein
MVVRRGGHFRLDWRISDPRVVRVAESNTQASEDAGAESGSLVALVRTHHAEILSKWLKAIQECAPVSRLSPQELVNHLPVVLDRLETTLGFIEADNWAGIALEAAERHAEQRLGVGFDLREVVTEFFLLRHILSGFLWEHRRPGDDGLHEAVALDWTVDIAIRESIEAYTGMRQSLLEALERLSSAALESRSLDEVLPKLLHVIVDMTAEVDTVALFLAEGDSLVFRAAVGIEEPTEAGFRLPIGEGIAGRVALTRLPMLWSPSSESSEGPSPRSPRLLGRRLRALYALPLIADDTLLGVMQMGSVTVPDFSDRDRVFLRATADRVAAALMQHKLRDEAERAAALLDSIYSAAPVGYAFLDRDLRFVRVNAALTETTGIQADDSLGKRPSELAATFPNVAQLEAEWRQVMETGQPRLDAEIAGSFPIAPRRHTCLLASWYPVRVHEETVGLAVIVRDVTAQKEHEQFQERVLGIVGHDMRTPLMAIRMSADLLLREAGNGKSQGSVARILRSAERLEGMVADLVDLTRTRGGHTLPIDPRSIDLATLCHHAIEEAEAARPGCRFELSVSGDTNGAWDPGRLAQLLSNLLGNAATYCSPGTSIAVRCSGGAEAVDLEVENHGPPISPELAPHIFEPFRRGVGQTNRKQDGLGLGLFIAREIVHAHSGTIWFDSDEQRTVFRVRLPRAPAVPAKVSAKT